ncbi:MAG: hypothetical protein ACYS14_11145, partial [Planctomycetota bacterium]
TCDRFLLRFPGQANFLVGRAHKNSLLFTCIPETTPFKPFSCYPLELSESFWYNVFIAQG